MNRLTYGLLLITAPVFADAVQIDHCVGIDEDMARLACYDAAVGKTTAAVTPGKVTSPKQDMPATATAADASIAAAPTVAAPSAKPVPPVAARAESDKDTFGFENQRLENDERIVSRYDGTFTGWSGRTLFRLENGQVWRQSDTGRFKTTLERPTLIIERAAFGSFRLNVDGMNRSVRVKRVR